MVQGFSFVCRLLVGNWLCVCYGGVLGILLQGHQWSMSEVLFHV